MFVYGSFALAICFFLAYTVFVKNPSTPHIYASVNNPWFCTPGADGSFMSAGEAIRMRKVHILTGIGKRYIMRQAANATLVAYVVSETNADRWFIRLIAK